MTPELSGDPFSSFRSPTFGTDPAIASTGGAANIFIECTGRTMSLHLHRPFFIEISVRLIPAVPPNSVQSVRRIVFLFMTCSEILF